MIIIKMMMMIRVRMIYCSWDLWLFDLLHPDDDKDDNDEGDLLLFMMIMMMRMMRIRMRICMRMRMRMRMRMSMRMRTIIRIVKIIPSVVFIPIPDSPCPGEPVWGHPLAVWGLYSLNIVDSYEVQLSWV